MREDRKKIVILIALWLFCLPGFLVGHTLWLNVTNFYPGLREKTVLYFGWGHCYPVDDFLNKMMLDEFILLEPDGTRKELTPGAGGFLETELKFDQESYYLVGASLKPGYYTMSQDDKGNIHHRIMPKSEAQNEKIILSLYYEEYAKAIIAAGISREYKCEKHSVQQGESSEKPWSRAVGHKFEIMPLRKPNCFKVSQSTLPIKVMFDGQPARFCQVFATYTGFANDDSFAFSTMTDDKGKARIRILHYGKWLIKATLLKPAPPELKDKCDALSFSATLTFEVP